MSAYPTEDERITVERSVDELMSRADVPRFAISTPGLLGEIDDAKAVPANGAGAVHDWVSWMASTALPAESG